jgi:hypothetical protein
VQRGEVEPAGAPRHELAVDDGVVGQLRIAAAMSGK